VVPVAASVYFAPNFHAHSSATPTVDTPAGVVAPASPVRLTRLCNSYAATPLNPKFSQVAAKL